jgi:formate hydrogenlyase subunit 3/multisubunit Na+/H+ antiporter MnhD subunit
VNALALAFVAWGLGAVGALVSRRSRGANVAGAAAAAIGGAAAVVAAIRAMHTGIPSYWRTAWTLPAGSLALRLDALAGVFLLPVGAIGALCAVYGVAYLRAHEHAHGGDRGDGASFAAFNVLLASMALVVTADDLLLLIVAWELMTLSSWVLVVSDHGALAVRKAGLLYLVAAHVATVALLVLVMLLANASGPGGEGTFVISNIGATGAAPSAAVWLFLLALIGFGTKAGIVPMHVWLPDAHPAAPSHVSALMSAVMITMGFYGLSRFLPLFGEPSAWWGYLLMTLGATGAMGGIAYSVAQRDVKRALAYSTIENAGIVTLAIGVGILAAALHAPMLSGLAWTAALLHVWNHALAKALLFLGFGSAAQAVGSRHIDAMGGLLERWRTFGVMIVIGAAAIASLPGLNVFTSEWLLLRALFAGSLEQTGVARVALLGGVVSLALTGGMVVVSFTRLVGLTLLGAPRTAAATEARAPGWPMWLPMMALAAACAAIAAMPGQMSGALTGAVHIAAPFADVAGVAAVVEPLARLLPLVAGAVILVAAVRGLLRRPALERRGATWGCGYPAPTPRMQYSSTSFGEPLTRVLQPVLAVRTHAEDGTRWWSDAPDRVLTGAYTPIALGVRAAGQRLRALQAPRITRSLLYVIATVLVLMALLFRPGPGR